METSVAKRPRLEPRKPEEIIQEQRQVIENQKARTSDSSATEIKIKHVLVPELPNETWLEIMSYLSTYDILRNVAGVSKKFYELSQDHHLIRQIEVDSETWTKIQEGKHCEDFFKVLKGS